MTIASTDGASAGRKPVTDGAAHRDGARPRASASDERAGLARAVAGVGVWEFDPERRSFTLDDTACALLGLADCDASEDDVLGVIVEEDRSRIRRALHAHAEEGEGYDQSFRVMVGGETRWLHSIGRSLGSDGSARLTGVSFDTTAEHEALVARDLLLREMNHRIKNLFAVIGGMISLCAREAETPRGLADDLGKRIAAMGRAHTLTQQTMVERALELHELIEAVIAPARMGQSIVIEGEPLQVPIALVTPLALIFHEWATNAAKYGALADPEGTLSVRWASDAGTTTIEWRETNASAASTDTGPAGFGTRLIEATVAQLRARLTGEHGEGILVRRIEVAGLG